MSINPVRMIKYFLKFLIVAIALLSVIILITFKPLNNLILFTSFSINIMSLYFLIYHIQSIGSNISTFTMILIFLNNIFLSLIRLIINNQSLHSEIKEFFFFNSNCIGLYKNILHSSKLYSKKNFFLWKWNIEYI
jgi:hypothetical protein